MNNPSNVPPYVFLGTSPASKLMILSATTFACPGVFARAFCSSNAMMSPAAKMFLYSVSWSVGAIRT